MDGASTAMAGPADDTEVRVSFFTRRPEFVIPDIPVTVPGRLRRAALSVMVNHLLQLGASSSSRASCLVLRLASPRPVPPQPLTFELLPPYALRHNRPPARAGCVWSLASPDLQPRACARPLLCASTPSSSLHCFPRRAHSWLYTGHSRSACDDLACLALSCEGCERSRKSVRH
jgi:hypothetical protein